MIWQFFPFRALSDPSLQYWHELNERHFAGHPGLDSQYMGLLLQHYGDGNELVAIASQDSELFAGAIIKKVGWQVWTLFLPGQACLSPLVYDKESDGCHIVSSLQQSIPGGCLLLRTPKLDPAFQAMTAPADNPRMDISEYGTTYSVSLSCEFDTYWSARSKRLRQKFRQIMRKLDSSGIEVSLSSVSDSKHITDGVRIHAEIESGGWKGQRGSAIGVKNRQGDFYRELFQSFADRKQALAFQLRFDGQPVASLMCISSGRMMITLKTSYREDFSDYSPGRLIDYLIFQDLLPSTDNDTMEMYTRASHSDLSWATDHRLMFDMNVYRYRWIKSLADVTKNLRSATRFRSPGLSEKS